jgi:hypothetical protein
MFSVHKAERAIVSLDSMAVVPIDKQVSFSMGSEAVGRLINGFSNSEGQSVWSHGLRSSVGVVMAPSPVSYRLTVRGRALAALAPLSVQGKVAGVDVGIAVFSAKMGESAWTIPANVVRAGLNELEFSYPNTARPAELDPKSRDRRPLALKFSRISLAPAY